MSTATATPTTTERAVRNSLTAGQLPSWAPTAVLIGAFLVSGVIFVTAWMLSGKPFLNLNASTGALLGLNFNWGAWLALAGLLFLIAIWALSSAVEGRRAATNRFVTGLVTAAFVMAMIPLASLLFTLFFNGIPGLNGDFFTHDAASPQARGGLHAIVGTLLITLATTLISVPIGIFTAIYLVEYGKGNWLSKAINFFVDVMTGIPSIVAGLFAFALFLLVASSVGAQLTNLRVGIAGAIALVVLMIPTVVRSAEEMIRLVPHDLREASYALGVPKWRTIAKVVLPTALAGLVTGVLLAIARVIGETAPLLVAAGMTQYMNWNLFQDAMSSLPTFVYQSWKFADAVHNQLAWTGALVLLIIVLLLNVIGRLVSYYFSPKSGR